MEHGLRHDVRAAKGATCAYDLVKAKVKTADIRPAGIYCENFDVIPVNTEVLLRFAGNPNTNHPQILTTGFRAELTKIMTHRTIGETTTHEARAAGYANKKAFLKYLQSRHALLRAMNPNDFRELWSSFIRFRILETIPNLQPITELGIGVGTFKQEKEEVAA